jgi:tetratricopeptide (TPR) repeat protein
MVHFYDNSRRISIAKSCFLLLAGLGLFLATFGCEKKFGKTSVLSDKPIADFQAKLFDIAFESSAKLPVNPHIKNRARAQEAVVTTCLELKQPKRALGFIERMDKHWNRNLCYANLAFYCAENGQSDAAKEYLAIAAKVPDESQEWRTDRVKARIAQTYTLLGNKNQASQFGKDLENSETGKVAVVQAAAGDEDSFNKQVKELDELIARGNFDIHTNAVRAYAQLFNRFYNNSQRRSLAEDKIKASWSNMPVPIQIEILAELSGFAIKHSDRSRAIELLNEAKLLLDSGECLPEQRIAMMAKVVELRFRAGDTEKALADANATLALFDSERDNIVNLYRAGALRPLAEAYKSIGAADTALSVYKRAIEEGVVNHASRPRAEDLSATCCSMALSAVEPDAQLWARINQIYEALGDPW